MLVERIRQIHDKKEEFKKELLQSKKNSITLARERNDTQIQLAELEQSIESIGGNALETLRNIQQNKNKNSISRMQQQQLENQIKRQEQLMKDRL